MLKKILLLIIIVFAVAGCASGLKQANLNARESYRSGALKDIGKGDVIGLLTATNEGGLEYRKLLGEFVEDALKRGRPEIETIPYWKSLSAINEKGLTREYSEMLGRYSSTGILDREFLRKLGDALGARYFLQPRLIKFEQRQSTRFSLLGLTLFKTQECEIKIYMELWDAATGSIAWIGVSDANMADESFRARPIPFEEVARAAIEDLIKKLP